MFTLVMVGRDCELSFSGTQEQTKAACFLCRVRLRLRGSKVTLYVRSIACSLASNYPFWQCAGVRDFTKATLAHVIRINLGRAAPGPCHSLQDGIEIDDGLVINQDREVQDCEISTHDRHRVGTYMVISHGSRFGESLEWLPSV